MENDNEREGLEKFIPVTLTVTHESWVRYNFETGEFEASFPITREKIDQIFPPWVVEAAKNAR